MNRRMNWAKFLLLLLTLGLLMGTAQAQAEEIFVMEEGRITDEGALPDSDELLENYISKQMFGASMFSTNYGESLMKDELNLDIYRQMKSMVEAVAANGGSTVFTIETDAMEAVRADISDIAADDPDRIQLIRNRVRAAVTEALPAQDLFNALLIDCAYELYWFDKTEGMGMGWSFAYNSREAWLVRMTYVMYVSEDYRVDGYDENNPAVTSDVSAISAAVANARATVQANASKSDWDKLNAYKNYICAANSYNHEAADNEDTPYGDPWQMIYVFDGDSSTNVVCEGYSKAFSYLCELSAFSDDDFACYLMTGDLGQNGTNLGGHMWNVVSLNNCNYLVDVTNVDSGDGTPNDELFMVSSPRTGNANGYTISYGSGYISFTYDDSTKSSFSEKQRTLGPFAASAYAVTLPVGEGYTASAAEGSVSPVTKNGSFSFTVTLNDGYEKSADFAVRANGTALTEQNGLYTITNIRADQTVTVEGVVKHVHLSMMVDETPATCTTDGKKQHFCCGLCRQLFWDQECTQPVTDATELIIPAGHGEFIEKVDEAYLIEGPNCQRGALYHASCADCGDASETMTFTAGEIGKHRFYSSFECDVCDYALEFLFPERLVEIDAGAFEGNANLTYLKLPDTVERIGAGAFRNCANLEYVFIGRNVTSIAADAFEGCPNLGIDADPGTYAAQYAEERGIFLNLCPPMPDIDIPDEDIDDFIEGVLRPEPDAAEG